LFSLLDELIIKFPSIHKHGIGCLSFSPNSNFIISTGYKIDRQLVIWNWKKGIKKIIYKLGNKVNNICFYSDGNSFITAGDRHLKWWYIQGIIILYLFGYIFLIIIIVIFLFIESSSNSGNSANLNLIGKPASILELFATSNFTDICYGQGKYSSFVYCITSTGLLCTFNHSSR
jgi:WD40 repeat protein